MNRYQFEDGNPINRQDPTGLDPHAYNPPHTGLNFIPFGQAPVYDTSTAGALRSYDEGKVIVAPRGNVNFTPYLGPSRPVGPVADNPEPLFPIAPQLPAPDYPMPYSLPPTHTVVRVVHVPGGFGYVGYVSPTGQKLIYYTKTGDYWIVVTEQAPLWDPGD